MGLDDDFLAMTPKAQVTTLRINKWNYIKLKHFCTARKTFNRVKDNPQNDKK